VGSKNNMMFNEQDRNSCTSDDFIVNSSTPSLVLRTLTITYSELNPDLRQGGKKITFVCRGFRNPIQPEIIKGFRILFYDSEFGDPFAPNPNQI
jgi:hypothetical protein